MGRPFRGVLNRFGEKAVLATDGHECTRIGGLNPFDETRGKDALYRPMIIPLR